MLVIHAIASTFDEIKQMQGSKYVQSKLEGVFPTIKQLLNEQKKVLFTGTPCQVAGLRMYLRKPYPNLLTIDLICHGVASPGIFKEYVHMVEKRLKKKIESIRMRDKEKGWSHRYFYRYIFKDGTSVGSDKLKCAQWGRICFSDLVTRPSCEHCLFTKYERVGDLTIGDYWDDMNQRPEIYSQKGTSLFLINTEKGFNAFKKIVENNHCWSLTREQAFQPRLDKPHKANPNCQSFLNFYIQKGFRKTYNRYFSQSFKSRLVRKIYKILGCPIL